MIPEWPRYENGGRPDRARSDRIGLGDRVRIVSADEKIHGRTGSVKGLMFREGQFTKVSVRFDGHGVGTEYLFTDELEQLTDESARISCDGGMTFWRSDQIGRMHEQAARYVHEYWDVTIGFMDDFIRERVADEEPESNEEFLKRYLELADKDLVIS